VLAESRENHNTLFFAKLRMSWKSFFQGYIFYSDHSSYSYCTNVPVTKYLFGFWVKLDKRILAKTHSDKND
jgi:hypothetical protein